MEKYIEMASRDLERLQEQKIEEAKVECVTKYGLKVLENSTEPFYNSTSDKHFCAPYFDGLLCWPPTPSNTLVLGQCPGHVVGFLKDQNASRWCTETGYWFLADNPKRYWTNYTQCFTAEYPTLEILFPPPSNTIPEFYVALVKTISRTGYTFSLCALIIAFVIMITIKKLHCPRNKLHMHLFASFLLKIFFTILKDFLFVGGVGLESNIRQKNGASYFYVDRESNNWTCKFIISLWEFFIVANYSWILMEGLYLHNLIFRALFADSSRNILHYIILGWGLPILVIIPWIITRLIYDDALCWTTHNDKNIFLIIRIPIMISILINLILFVRITFVIFNKLQAPVYEEAQRYQKWAKSTLVLVPLFGIHYALFLGMSYSMDENRTMEIIWLICDQLFASFQGLFVAILYCFLNGEVRSELKPHVHSFLTAWATHNCLKYLFPCRQNYLRSGRGRPSVCTTMSCSSLYNNGINTQRNSRTKWDIVPKTKHTHIQDKNKDHTCRPNIRSWHDISSRWSSSGATKNTHHQYNFCSNGSIPNEKTPYLEHQNEKSKSEPHLMNEKLCMLSQQHP